MTDKLEPNLEHLQHPLVLKLSGEMFGSAIRLPILGAVLELTPTLEEDVFHGRQVSRLLDFDPSNTYNELQRQMRAQLISPRESGPNDRKNIVRYGRLDHPRWEIARVALYIVMDEIVDGNLKTTETEDPYELFKLG